MIRKIVTFFDKLEDKIRAHLSRYPILYTFVGGIAIVLFWRGVWHTADILQAQGGFFGWFFYEPVSLVFTIIILLMTGLFVSYFIGDRILLSGLKGQKKDTERTEKEIQEEEVELNQMKTSIKEIKKEVDAIEKIVEYEYEAHHPHTNGEVKK
ncbi:MAG: hypothetical protein WCG07_00680 [Candidatus Taylorbacteria bacterium]